MIRQKPEGAGLSIGDPLKAPIPAIAEDGTLYPVGKLEAHERGLLHQAISIFLFHGDRLLLQRRASGKYHCPGLWANTCCSHPHWGESVEACAHRRLREELGLSAPLRAVGETRYRAPVGGGLTEHEHVHLFVGRLESESPRMAPNPEEVSETRFAGAASLQKELNEAPDGLAPWFRIYLSRWPDLVIGA